MPKSGNRPTNPYHGSPHFVTGADSTKLSTGQKNTMPNSSAGTPNEALSKEEGEVRVRNMYLHGSRSYDEIQELADSCLIPNVDWILACVVRGPETACFADEAPAGFVISWALMNKCYPLLQ
jgi:hypothetical protein